MFKSGVGYSVSDENWSDNGMTATLTRTNNEKTPFGTDNYETLEFLVEYQTDSRIRIRVS